MNAEDLIREQQPQAVFVEHPFYEKLLRLRDTDKKAFDSISPTAKLSLLQYEANKRKADSLRLDDSMIH